MKEFTGDTQLSKNEAERTDVLVTTPEKWDVVTRKGGLLAESCGLLIIDEVHLLAEERGSVIESIVARLHRYVETSQELCRIIGLSATLPNYKGEPSNEVIIVSIQQLAYIFDVLNTRCCTFSQSEMFLFWS